MWFHVINVPTTLNDKTSSAIHMVSSLLDIQPAMAIAHPVDRATIHSTTYVTKMVRMSFLEEESLRLILLLK